jgi:hypothetical protein
MLTPWAISGLRGDAETRESEAKFAGRIFAYNPSAFLRARRPCSGRTGLSTPHFGPPTEPSGNQRAEEKGQDVVKDQPIRMASASWHAFSVAAGSGSPTASMAFPPNWWDSNLSSNEVDALETASRILTASAVTSGPVSRAQGPWSDAIGDCRDDQHRFHRRARPQCGSWKQKRER